MPCYPFPLARFRVSILVLCSAIHLPISHHPHQEQTSEVGDVADHRGRGEKPCLALYGILKAFRKEPCYHMRCSWSAFQVRWSGKSGTTFESLPIAIVLRFANRLALCPDNNHRARKTCIPRHLQNAVVTIVFSGQLDVEEIAVWKSANRFWQHNHIWRESSHRVPPWEKPGIQTHHHRFVNSRETLAGTGFHPIEVLKLASRGSSNIRGSVTIVWRWFLEWQSHATRVSIASGDGPD